MKKVYNSIILIVLIFIFLVGCNVKSNNIDDYNSFIGMSRNDILSNLTNFEILISYNDYEIYELRNDNINIYVTYDDMNYATDVRVENTVMETQEDFLIFSEESIEIDNIIFPIPENIDKILNYSYNEVYLLSKNYDSIIEYYQKLSDDNWVLIKPKKPNSPYTTYVKEAQSLVIMDQEISPNIIEMKIQYYEGINNGEKTKNFASIIKGFLDYEKIYHILEYNISNATDKLGLSGFYVFTDKVDPVKLIVDKYNNIIKINYDQFLVYDIDFDGEYEFITKLGDGSGQYIITFSVWKYNEIDKKLVLLYQTQYEQLDQLDMFLNENKNGVEIIGAIWNNGNIENSQSYGNLIIDGEMLIPEKKDIPFKIYVPNIIK